MRTTYFVSAALAATAVNADVITWFAGFGVDLAHWNDGLMKSLQINPNDQTTECYYRT